MAHEINEIFRLKLNEQFKVFEHSLTSAKREEVAGYLNTYLYNEERIDKGIEINSRARERYYDQIRTYGEQISTTENLHKLKTSVQKRVKKSWKVAQLAIEDLGIRKTLGIHQPMRRSIHAWSKQFDRFYRNITPEVREFLAEYGYSEEKLQEEHELVSSVIIAHKKQIDITGEAQRATIERDEELYKLHRWMRRFYQITKLSLADNPENIKLLGIR